MCGFAVETIGTVPGSNCIQFRLIIEHGSSNIVRISLNP